ncbi:hypothetical protein DEO72_LG3g2326 [Vigna unguiculata]|uniref:Uncharacterized protein n=1 Tax=Vigna unguiculata TaxID=3917 RepID=A0A4D6LHG4_VIGUN|nr:hypothetical protein DEO72_LG3g2326 [Vigna unguiculata]
MITYIGQGKVEKTILEQTVANTVPPTRVSPKLEVIAQAREVPSLKRALLAQARSTVGIARFQRVLAQAKVSCLSETASR